MLTHAGPLITSLLTFPAHTRTILVKHMAMRPLRFEPDLVVSFQRLVPVSACVENWQALTPTSLDLAVQVLLDLVVLTVLEIEARLDGSKGQALRHSEEDEGFVLPWSQRRGSTEVSLGEVGVEGWPWWWSRRRGTSARAGRRGRMG